MELQTAKQICKLTNEELTMMINKAFVALTQDKTEERKATYIYEAGGFLSSFKHCCQHDDNTIFLSLIDMSYFNPLCAHLYSQYPNMAEEVMKEDNLTALISLVNMLAHKGYKLAIRDTFCDQDVTSSILEALKAYGYDTDMVVFKNGLYNENMRRIYDKACDLILGFKVHDISFFKIAMQVLLNYLQKDLVSSIYVSDGIINQQYKRDKTGQIHTKAIVNNLSDYLETDFYTHLEDLAYFIEGRRTFLKEEDYLMLMNAIETLKKSYYRSIDLAFFDADKAR